MIPTAMDAVAAHGAGIASKVVDAVALQCAGLALRDVEILVPIYIHYRSAWHRAASAAVMVRLIAHCSHSSPHPSRDLANPQLGFIDFVVAPL